VFRHLSIHFNFASYHHGTPVFFLFFSAFFCGVAVEEAPIYVAVSRFFLNIAVPAIVLEGFYADSEFYSTVD